MEGTPTSNHPSHAGENAVWPREFGRYILLSPLAQGGMGDVCLALAGEIASAQRLCVVKTVRPEYAREEEFLARFVDEGRVLCALTHPNIGQMLEVGLEGKTPFVAMEHVAGIDLDALIYAARQARAHLPMEFVFIVIAGVLDGMAYAHRATALDGTALQLVHRDISPQNIRMSWDGDVKVLDFGTAYATGRGMQTQHGLVFGKPGYMSPEQARGEKVDARSDLFAIAVVMWELLADKEFAVADASDHMEALAGGSYSFVPPTKLRRDAPRELDEWFETISAWSAEQRFVDANTARRRLVDIGTSRGIRFEREAIARTLARYFPNDREQENARIRKLVAQARNMRTDAPPISVMRGSTAPLPTAEFDVVRGTRYRIGDRLGRGGMGEVYAAEHVDLGRKVALKVLFPERSNDPAVVQRFRLEARAIAKLKHPNLVEVYDLGNTEDGRLFYAMERLEGETLRDRLSRGVTEAEHRLTAAECVYVGVSVAKGLAAAHETGVVHRDIKPENIFLTRDHGVKLLDFGVAKTNNSEILDGVDRHETRAGEIFGSPAYMAPEQARNRAVDGRTDIYALGAVLYECLTGGVMFDGASLVETLTQQIVKAPIAPHERCPEANIPAGIEAVVLRCLEKDPNKRFGNAAALAHALESCLTDDPAVIAEITGSARRSSAVETTPLDPTTERVSIDGTLPLIKPRRSAYIGGALALLLAGLGLWVALREPTRLDTHALQSDAGSPVDPTRRSGAGDVPAVPALPDLPQRQARPPVAPLDVAALASEDASATAPADARSAGTSHTPDRPRDNPVERAERYLRDGNYSLAIQSAEDAISSQQNVLRAQMVRGLAFLRSGRRREALDTFCLVVGRATAGSRPQNDACAKIRAAEGCSATTSLPASRSCCVTCGMTR